MNTESNKFRDNLVHYAIYAIIAFILISTILSFWNRYVTYDTRAIIEKARDTEHLLMAIQEEVVNDATMSVHAFANTRDTSFAHHLQKIFISKDSIFRRLTENLQDYKYETASLKQIHASVHEYLLEAQRLVKSLQQDTSTTSSEQLQAFTYKKFQEYLTYRGQIDARLKEIKENAESDHDWSIVDNAIIQVILVLLSIPILIITSRKLNREVQNNRILLVELDAHNRKLLFDDGTQPEITAQSVVSRSIESLRMAFSFVTHVSGSNYSEAERLMNEEIQKKNANTLMGALLTMSGKLKRADDEDKKRQWTSNGLNQLYEIVQKNQQDQSALAMNTVAFITKYLGAQQAGLFFVLMEDEERYLKLEACYAFDRKKWIDKKINIGEGIVGQVYLEGEPVLMSDIPNGYVHITSGLGHATPRNLLVVPFIYKERTEAVIEIASFSNFEGHHIEFLKKSGEFLASAIQTSRSNSEMQIVLTQAQEQAEMLRAQEEELRQNLEEMEATNEAMRRIEAHR